MPWTDKPGGTGQGGNGSGGGRGPWGQPPRGGNDNNDGGNRGGNRGGNGQQPPDLEELLRSGRERFKRSMGGRGGSSGGGGGGVKLPGKGIFFIAIVLLAILAAFNMFYTVQPGERGVVTTFGKYSDMTAPGLRWHLPWPIQQVEVVSVTAERTTDIGVSSNRSESTMLTSDLNIVDVSISVNWRIKTDPVEDGELPGPAKYLFNNEDAESMVRAVAESALREVVGGNELDPIISNGRAIVPQDTLEVMQRTLDSYNSGIDIIRINFQRSDPPSQVIDAFRDVIDARSDAETTINQAQRTANEIVPVARGQAQQMILDAEAYEARVVAEARGAAARFNNIYDEYAKAPEVTRQRMYLETMEKVLGDMDKVVIDQEAGGTVPFLSINELTRQRQNNN